MLVSFVPHGVLSQSASWSLYIMVELTNTVGAGKHNGLSDSQHRVPELCIEARAKPGSRSSSAGEQCDMVGHAIQSSSYTDLASKHDWGNKQARKSCKTDSLAIEYNRTEGSSTSGFCVK